MGFPGLFFHSLFPVHGPSGLKHNEVLCVRPAPPRLCTTSRFWCLGKMGVWGRVEVQVFGHFASAGWHLAHFMFFIPQRTVGGEGMEKDADFPITGLGEMSPLRHVEKSALLCKHKPGESVKVTFPCSSSHGHRQAVPSAAPGDTFCALCVPCVPVLSSVLTRLLPLCQGSSFVSLASLARRVVVCPPVRILVSQRHQVACLSHTASEDQSKMHPGVIPSPVLSPPASGPPKVLCKRRGMGFF